MSTEIRIDAKFLSPKVAKRFNKKNRTIFEKAYNKVMENLRDPSVLSYLRRLYIIPYITTELIPINERKASLHTHFANQSVDPSDITKLAIFAPIYLKRLPLKEITFTLAHEIAHFVQRRGSVDYALEDLISTLEKRRQVRIEARKESAKKEYNIFKEPFRKALTKSDETLGKYIEQLKAGAKIMKLQDFLKYILGDKYEELKKIFEKKLRNRGVI